MTYTTTQPKISIQMCTYNRGHFIKDAVDSVLIQTCTDWELLILDDASTDNTEQVLLPYLADPRIRYIKNDRNQGITKNRNKALALANGEYIAVLDSDDYWTDKDKLHKQAEFLDTHPDHVLVGTNMTIVNEEGKTVKKIRYPASSALIKKALLLKNMFCHSSAVYRKKEALELGSYDESLPIWEDYDLWLRMGAKHKLANLSTYSTAYRRHQNQSDTSKKKAAHDAQLQIMKKYRGVYPFYTAAKIARIIKNKLQ